MSKTNEELYFELKEKMLDAIESEEFYNIFNNSIRSGKNNFSLYQRYMNSVIDIKWVEKIEESLVALDNIIRNPQRFIKQTEEVIPIEQVKRVSENSIRHLAQNTSLIAKIDNKGFITPSKLLNIQKDETFETYENRFIYTLLLHLQYFIDKRLKALHDARVKSEYKIEMENEFVIGDEKIEYQLSMTSTEKTEKKSDEIDLNADTSQMDATRRVERLIQIMYDFQNSQLIKSLRGTTLVKPPIMRTNVILKNPNFKKALELWQYIETYYDAGVSIELVENEVVPSEEYINDLFTSTLINYCLFNHHIKPTKQMATKSPALKKFKPNFVKHIVKDYLEDLQVDVDIVEKVFVDQIKRATAKRKATDKAIAKAIDNAIEKELKNLEKQNLQDEKRLEKARKEMERRRREEEERLRRLEEERLKEIAELEALTKQEEVIENSEETKEEIVEETVVVEEVMEVEVLQTEEAVVAETIEEVQTIEEAPKEEENEEIVEEIKEEVVGDALVEEVQTIEESIEVVEEEKQQEIVTEQPQQEAKVRRSRKEKRATKVTIYNRRKLAKIEQDARLKALALKKEQEELEALKQQEQLVEEIQEPILEQVSEEVVNQEVIEMVEESVEDTKLEEMAERLELEASLQEEVVSIEVEEEPTFIEESTYEPIEQDVLEEKVSWFNRLKQKRLERKAFYNRRKLAKVEYDLKSKEQNTKLEEIQEPILEQVNEEVPQEIVLEQKVEQKEEIIQEELIQEVIEQSIEEVQEEAIIEPDQVIDDVVLEEETIETINLEFSKLYEEKPQEVNLKVVENKNKPNMVRVAKKRYNKRKRGFSYKILDNVNENKVEVNIIKQKEAIDESQIKKKKIHK